MEHKDISSNSLLHTVDNLQVRVPKKTGEGCGQEGRERNGVVFGDREHWNFCCGTTATCTSFFYWPVNLPVCYAITWIHFEMRASCEKKKKNRLLAVYAAWTLVNYLVESWKRSIEPAERAQALKLGFWGHREPRSPKLLWDREMFGNCCSFLPSISFYSFILLTYD